MIRLYYFLMVIESPTDLKMTLGDMIANVGKGCIDRLLGPAKLGARIAGRESNRAVFRVGTLRWRAATA